MSPDIRGDTNFTIANDIHYIHLYRVGVKIGINCSKRYVISKTVGSFKERTVIYSDFIDWPGKHLLNVLYFANLVPKNMI